MIALVAAALSADLGRDLADILGTGFMRNAFLVGGLVAVAAGLVGYFVLLRNQVFTSDALGHVAFTGGLGGLVLGLPLLASVFGATVGSALAIGTLGGRGRGRDVTIGTVFAWILGLGVLFVSIYRTGGHAASGVLGIGVLFGSILSLEPQQVTVASVAAVATSLGLLAIARPLLFASLDPEVAASRGLPVGWITGAFLLLLGASVAEAVQAVGALLIFGLLVTPAAIAQDLTTNPYRGVVLSAALALGFVWAGLVVGYYCTVPVSFLVVAISFGSLLVSACGQSLAAGIRARAALGPA